MKLEPDRLLTFLTKLIKGWKERNYRRKNPPQHSRKSVLGKSVEDCLRKLEDKADLPRNDLFVTGIPIKVTTWPVPCDGLVYVVNSKTSELWRAKGSGYISGDVFEKTSPNKLTSEQKLILTPLTACAVQMADSVSFYATLHVSKNCPGVFNINDTCTSCGYVMRH